MAAPTSKPTKRKSVDATEQLPKKVKIAQSAERPQPKKSALKKTTDVTGSADHKNTANAKKQSKNSKPKAEADSAPISSTRSSKTKLAKQTEKEVPPVIEENDDDEEAVLTADRTAELLAGFSSSEDEDEDDLGEGTDLSRLPKAPISAALATSLTTVAETGSNSSSGVIYVGRIPHGFFESQMRAYFGQFGDILKLRLARNKKTGQSKHYAFIEFSSSEVAEIVAKTMDKYLLFGHILQVRVVPAAELEGSTFKGAGRRRKVKPRNRMEGARLKNGTDKAGWEKRIGRETEKRQATAEKLREIGYGFEMPKVKPVQAASNPDQQLIQETEQAVTEAAIASVADITALDKGTKKRVAVNSGPEAKKTKKVKSKK